MYGSHSHRHLFLTRDTRFRNIRFFRATNLHVHLHVDMQSSKYSPSALHLERAHVVPLGVVAHLGRHAQLHLAARAHLPLLRSTAPCPLAARSWLCASHHRERQLAQRTCAFSAHPARARVRREHSFDQRASPRCRGRPACAHLARHPTSLIPKQCSSCVLHLRRVATCSIDKSLRWRHPLILCDGCPHPQIMHRPPPSSASSDHSLSTSPRATVAAATCLPRDAPLSLVHGATGMPSSSMVAAPLGSGVSGRLLVVPRRLDRRSTRKSWRRSSGWSLTSWLPTA